MRDAAKAFEDLVVWQKAQWLLSPAVGGPRSVPPAGYLRREFTVTGAVRSAVLHITALGLYECEINGRRIGDHVFAPGWTDYRKRVFFQSYDVTAELRDGANAMGVILGDGWYSGFVAQLDRQFYGDRPRLLAQLEITGTDGRVTCIATDTAWTTSLGPILENDLLMGETYDACRELGAWSSPGYNASGWSPAVCAPDPGIVIERSPGPPVRRMETLAPVCVRQGATLPGDPGPLRIFDLGQNIAGRVRLRVTAPRGTRLTIRHAEMLAPDGNLYTEFLRTAKATDNYTCGGGGGEQVWEPRFTYHGFRYVEVRGLRPEDTCSVEGIVLHSDLPRTGWFACSHELVTRLAENIRWTQKANSIEVPTDCPQRDERQGWTGDAQLFTRTACFHMDVRRFFHKWLQDVRDAQYPDGAIPAFVPHNGGFNTRGDGCPGWADAAFICPWTVYLCYGDLEILREQYACMTRYMRYVAEHKVKDHIREHYALPRDGMDWVNQRGGFNDWLAPAGDTPPDLIGTAYYANDADILAKTAALLGKPEEAATYRDLHARIVAAFRRRFVTPDGLVTSGTQTGYVLALHFGLIPEEARPGAARELVQLIKLRGMHVGTGLLGSAYLLHVLEAAGHLDIAYQLLEQEECPSWLFMVKSGGTTVWERWDTWNTERGFHPVKSMNSFNHPAFGSVGDWLVSTVAGLQFDPECPGYQHILFKPRPGGTITWAEAKLLTPQGEAAIRWDLRDGGLDLLLTVPEGNRATLALAEDWTASPTTFAPGLHTVRAAARSPVLSRVL